MGVIALIGYAVFAIRGGAPDRFTNTPTLDRAFLATKASGKPVLVLTWSDKNSVAKDLRAHALRDKKVEMWIRENTHPVLIDMGKDDAQARTLNISTSPTLVLLRDGKEVSRREGAGKAEQVLAWLQQHSGAASDWLYAHPGQPLPDISGYEPRVDHGEPEPPAKDDVQAGAPEPGN